jgi:class 3 adenylate cyclase
LAVVGGEVRYARSGGVDIAYKVAGAGPPDLVLVPGLLDVIEAESFYAPMRRLADHVSRYARLIRLDKRGTGFSERLPADAAPSLEDRVDDVIAVMDAAGSERATVLGVADGGAVAIMLAATHPERVSALVLNATTPRIAWSPDWPWGIRREERDAGLRIIEAQWGTGIMAASFGIIDPEHRGEFARLERLTSSPAAAARLIETFSSFDVRDLLPAVNVPTLVTHHVEHPVWPIEGARYLAANIPGARLVEYEGQPLALGPAGDDDYLDLVQETVTGARPSPSLDRVLKTVVFTDIVGSTERLTEVGDRRWSQLLDEHDAAVGRALDRLGGQRVNTTGDGYFAVFDGPARAVECARAIVADARRLGLDVRAGVHTGECEVRGDDYAGMAVHIGARVGALAAPGEVLVTSTVRDLVAGSGIEFRERGRHELRGIPGEWTLLSVI